MARARYNGRVSESRLKACPVCRTLAPVDTPSCVGCGHAYRTRFDGPPTVAASPPDALPSPPVPRVAPPPFRPPAAPVPRAPLEPFESRSLATPQDLSPSLALGRRRLPLLGGIAALVIAFRVLRLALDLGCALPRHR